MSISKDKEEENYKLVNISKDKEGDYKLINVSKDKEEEGHKLVHVRKVKKKDGKLINVSKDEVGKGYKLVSDINNAGLETFRENLLQKGFFFFFC